MPNTLRSHAAFAMNAYYQSSGRHDFNCDFGKTGVVTLSDPSKQPPLHSRCSLPLTQLAVFFFFL